MPLWTVCHIRHPVTFWYFLPLHEKRSENLLWQPLSPNCDLGGNIIQENIVCCDPWLFSFFFLLLLSPVNSSEVCEGERSPVKSVDAVWLTVGPATEEPCLNSTIQIRTKLLFLPKQQCAPFTYPDTSCLRFCPVHPCILTPLPEVFPFSTSTHTHPCEKELN